MIGRVNHKEVICIHLGSAQVGRRLIKQAENPSIEPAALATVKNTFLSYSLPTRYLKFGAKIVNVPFSLSF